MKKCCAENKDPKYDPKHIYMCPICQTVYPKKEKKEFEL